MVKSKSFHTKYMGRSESFRKKKNTLCGITHCRRFKKIIMKKMEEKMENENFIFILFWLNQCRRACITYNKESVALVFHYSSTTHPICLKPTSLLKLFPLLIVIKLLALLACIHEEVTNTNDFNSIYL